MIAKFEKWSDNCWIKVQYIFDVNQAIKSGNFSNDLWKLDPGPISHSRWFTYENRILILYMSVENTSDALKAIEAFILKSYTPVSFEIKYSKYIMDGIYRNKLIIAWRSKKIIFDAIERNSFFALPQNLMMAMVFDKRGKIKNKLRLRRV